MDVSFKFSGDNKDVLNSLKQIEKEIGGVKNKVGEDLGNLSSDLSKTVSKFAAGITAALGAISVFKLGKIGLADAFDDEIKTLKLSSFTQDFDFAKTLERQLDELAANGTISLDDLTQSAMNLIQAFGNTGAVYGWSQILADIAATGKTSATELSTAIQRVVTLGYVESKQLKNMLSSGLPLMKELESLTGETAAGVLKLAQNKSLSADTYLQAIKNMQSNNFEGLNSNLSNNTTLGALETLQATFENKMGDLFGSLSEKLRPIFTELTGLLNELTPKIIEMGNALGSIASGTYQGIKSFLNDFKGFELIIGTIVVAVSALIVKLYSLSQAAIRNNSAFIQLTNTMRAATGAVFSAMGSTFTSIFLMAKGVVSNFKAFSIASFSAIKIGWHGMCMVMKVTFKATMIAIKAAIVSTGVGIALIAIGEAAAWAYEKVMNLISDTPESDFSEKFNLDKFVDDSKSFKTLEQRNAVLEEIAKERERIVKGLNAITTDENYLIGTDKNYKPISREFKFNDDEFKKQQKSVVEFMNQLRNIDEKRSQIIKNSNDSIERNKEALILDELIKKNEEWAKAVEQSTEKAIDARRKYFEELAKSDIENSKTPEEKISKILKTGNLSSVKELLKEVNALDNQLLSGGGLDEESSNRYKDLLGMASQINKVNEDVAKKEAEKKESSSKILKESAQEEKILDAKLAKNEKLTKELELQAEIEKKKNQLIKEGVSETEASKIAKTMTSKEQRVKELEDKKNNPQTQMKEAQKSFNDFFSTRMKAVSETITSLGQLGGGFGGLFSGIANPMKDSKQIVNSLNQINKTLAQSNNYLSAIAKNTANNNNAAVFN